MGRNGLEGEAPEVLGDVAIGDTDGAVAVDDGGGEAQSEAAPQSKTNQPLQRDLENAQGTNRGKDGKFAPKEKVNGTTESDFKAHARKALGRETDSKALDAVKPKAQDSSAKTDQRQPAKGTLETGKDGSAATNQSADLEKARAALKLDRWTDEKLAILTPEQILAFGKSAQEEHRAKYQAGREAAAAAKNGKAQPPSTPAAPEDDAADIAAFEKLAAEQFGEYEGSEQFGKSLAGFAKGLTAHTRAKLAAEVETIRNEAVEGITQMRSELRRAITFETGLSELASDFPKAATPEGRKALSARVDLALKADPDLDVRAAMRTESNALWAEEIRAAEAARAKKLSAARSGGHVSVQSMGEAPRKKSDMDIAREAVERHMRS
jgi:hypothetical protein